MPRQGVPDTCVPAERFTGRASLRTAALFGIALLALESCGGGGGSGGGGQVNLNGGWLGTYSDSGGGSGRILISMMGIGDFDFDVSMGSCPFGGFTNWVPTGGNTFSATFTTGAGITFTMNGTASNGTDHLSGTFHLTGGSTPCLGPMGTFSADRIQPVEPAPRPPVVRVFLYDDHGNRLGVGRMVSR